MEGDYSLPSLLLGYDETHGINHVVFDNFGVSGKKVSSETALNATLQFTRDVIFK